MMGVEMKEQTGGQVAKGGGDLMHAIFGGDLPAPSPSTYRTFRAMRKNPTVALGRIVGTLPIRTAPITIEADEGVPEERVVWVQQEIDRLWPRLVRDMLYARDFGFAPFEKLWQVDKTSGWLTYRKLKYLLPEKTTILLEESDGSFGGLKQGKVELEPEKCLVYSYDREADNYYGEPLLANIVDTWSNWTHAFTKLGLYVTYAAGALPIIEYPPGTSRDAGGQEKSNYEHAVTLGQNIARGKAAVVPNVLAGYAEDLARGGINPEQFKAWRFTFLEAGNHGEEIVGILRHYETLMLRGELVPERAALEGQTGNRAEAETHGDLGGQIGNLELTDILRHLNEYVIDPMLGNNWGIDAEGSIRAKVDSTDPRSQAFFRDLVKQFATGVHTAEDLLRVVEIDTLVEQAGLPLVEIEGNQKPGKRNDLLDEAKRIMDKPMREDV